jgi:hypothetical protein
MEIVATATLWGLWSGWLLFPAFGVPRMLRVAAGGLIFAELIALGVWSYGSLGCGQRPCAALAEAGRTAASIDIPALSVAVLGLAVGWGMRRYRRSRTRARA